MYEIAMVGWPWDIAAMTTPADRKKAAEDYARELATRLTALKPPSLSERQWLDQANVSPSFFSNMRGTPTKGPSVPSVDNLRKVLSAAGVTLSEFFAPESNGRMMRAPTPQALERAVEEALAAMPKRHADRASFLIEAVRGVLALPADRLANRHNAGLSEQVGRAADVPQRVANSRP